MKSAVDRLSLGTVQFGMPYGISNRTGRIPKEEAFKILQYAHENGIDTLDTAYSYGESEERIGDFIAASGRNFNIVSKAPHLDKHGVSDIEGYCLETLKRLRKKNIYGYLIHKFDDIVRHKNQWSKLESLKRKGLVRKIGVSLYNPQDLEYLLSNDTRIDIIQFPYSVFDRRFEGYFALLKEKNIEIHVRSVFLQGFVFLKPDDLPSSLTKAGLLCRTDRGLV